MALTMIRLLCFAALMSFPGLEGHDHSGLLGHSDRSAKKGQTTGSFTVTVTNKLANTVVSYPANADGMPMFGVLNKLQDTTDFTFTYSVHNSYGIFLESVNGLAGSTVNKTYWELLSKKGKKTTRLDVGIGCYQPNKNEVFIMNFTSWA
ncbi:cobalamin binding intrinsic factor-like [Garra rufa]|uniref:cobalamin binding intrinsic factor-like n=1 Tax=Garra rufa TaxID=137080 RepID=UPI003CCED2C0